MSNRDELIDKVTAEVMKIYGVKSNNGDDCQKCSTEPSSSSKADRYQQRYTTNYQYQF